MTCALYIRDSEQTKESRYRVYYGTGSCLCQYCARGDYYHTLVCKLSIMLKPYDSEMDDNEVMEFLPEDD